MKKFKLSALMLSSLMIAACSGGGGGNDNKQPAPQSNLTNTAAQKAQTTAQTTPTTPNDTRQQSTTNTTQETSEVNLPNTEAHIDRNNFHKGELNQEIVVYKGSEIARLSGYNRKYSFNGALVKTKEQDIREILVDGVVKLGIKNFTGAIGGLTGRALSKMLGAFYNVVKDPERDIFYFGDETPETNIPKQGIVTYKGNAARYDNVEGQVDNIGDSELIANFDAKTIKGELDMNYPRRNITLHEAPIVGNGFNGRAVAEGNFPFFVSREGQYEGKFFGPNAEEVAGKATFDEGVKDLNTSFSAEKVSKQ